MPYQVLQQHTPGNYASDIADTTSRSITCLVLYVHAALAAGSRMTLRQRRPAHVPGVLCAAADAQEECVRTATLFRRSALAAAPRRVVRQGCSELRLGRSTASGKHST